MTPRSSLPDPGPITVIVALRAHGSGGRRGTTTANPTARRLGPVVLAAAP